MSSIPSTYAGEAHEMLVEVDVWFTTKTVENSLKSWKIVFLYFKKQKEKNKKNLVGCVSHPTGSGKICLFATGGGT
jgi:hypothetical protein